jgi:aspartyl-tRNA(Asn)/glutamyl-tRNA(Gln) amidotransferase subunit A
VARFGVVFPNAYFEHDLPVPVRALDRDVGHTAMLVAYSPVLESAVESARAVREKEVSPVELVERSLDRIDRWQQVINAFSQVRPEAALDEARAQADALARGEPAGLLAGVPIAVKELFDVTGWESSGCSLAYRGNVARRDAEAVRRLRDAGAVVVAKTNQHELAAGATNVISACGPTRNPWDPPRITGGSSGGSAAAVAARIVPLALGSDTGGSIRIPCSFCGTTGLKPTTARVSMEGAMVLAPSLDTAGPIAVTADDVALSLAALTNDQGLVEVSQRPPEKLRVGVAGGFFSERVHPEILEALEEVRSTLQEAGVLTSTTDLGDIRDAPEVWNRIAWPEFAVAHGRLLRRPETLYPRTRSRLEYGAARTAVDYLQAKERAAEIRDVFLEALQDVDALLAPTTPFTAPRADREEVEFGGVRWDVHRGGPAWLTRPVNLAGLPALALPAGFSREGVPLGVQLIGRPAGEGVLLRLARAYEEATGHQRRAPALRGDRSGA